MAKIDKITEQKILDAAKVSDVLRDHGVALSKRGNQLLGLCPFHDDRRVGSFVVNERGNYYKCFACEAKGDAVTVLRELDGMKYTEALRYLAAMYGIYIDDTPAPQVTKHEPRQPLPPTAMIYWNVEILKPYLHHTEDNNLLRWMLSLPMREEHKRTLRNMIELYCVGTSIQGATQGWTIFPQIDEQLRVRDMKLMAYKEDGHRNKELPYSFNWMHSMLEKSGRFNRDAHHIEHCLFGLHLTAAYPKAEVCIVESEKSALICSAFTNPNERIWLATGGKSGLNPSMIQPLIDMNRYIVLFPDVDGTDYWQQRMDAINYPRMSMTRKMRPISKGGLYDPRHDDPKADIADIMLRLVHGIEENEAEIVARRIDATAEQAQTIAYMMDKLKLTIDK